MKKFLFVTSVIFIAISIAFLYLPLGTIGLIPSVIALILSLIVFFISTKGEEQKKPKVLLAISILTIAIIIGKSTFIEEKIAVDKAFEEKMEQSEEENIQELENELEGLDLEEFDPEEDSLEIEE